MLTKDPDGGSRAVIMDFGLARRPSSLEPGTAATGVGGAFDYMGPELLRGEMPSAASDIYALGVILHELAYGNRPMDALELGRTDGAPRQHRHEWAPTIERCLDPDPASRFASACEVAKALAPRPRRSLMAKVGLGVMGVVIAAALVYPRWFPKQDISSVAVLPFVNTNNTPESEFLADDLSEGLLNVLAQLPDLTVIARSSSSHFHKSNLGVREIARQLNVRALVTGRVAQLDQNLRINVELVNGASGQQVWGKSYDGEANNLGRLREAISRDIARQIRSNLSGYETSKLISQGASARPEAYELLLRGRYQVRLYAPDATRKAISLFEQAVAIDPQYALAHAELANVYRLLGSAGVLNPQEALPMAEASARRALGLNKGLAEAHAVLADIKKDQWDWKAAEPEYRLALKLSPSGLADAVPQRERPEAAAKAASRAQAGKPQVDRPAETASAIGKGVGDNLEEYERANATPAGPLAPVVMDAAEREKLPAWLRGPIERMEQRWSRNREVAFANFKGSLLALAPYAVLLSLPLFAGLLKLLYPGQVYGAHFLFAMHLHAAWYLMLLLLVLVPLAALPLWAWSNVYPLLALKRVNGSGWGSTLLRGVVLALLHWMVIMLLVVVLVVVGAAAV